MGNQFDRDFINWRQIRQARLQVRQLPAEAAGQVAARESVLRSGGNIQQPPAAGVTRRCFSRVTVAALLFQQFRFA
jgi:hypothetical protein